MAKLSEPIRAAVLLRQRENTQIRLSLCACALASVHEGAFDGALGREGERGGQGMAR